MTTDLELVPVGPGELELLRRLFEPNRQTRHCFCMAFCSTPAQFALGWYAGGNRRRFGRLARSETAPMGLLVISDGVPVGWCACGPQERYRTRRTRDSPSPVGLDQRQGVIWQIACLVVGPAGTAGEVVPALLSGAVDLARHHGADAVEAWPLAHGVRSAGEVHVGREAIFARFGFRRLGVLSATRVIMRAEC